VRRAGDLFFYLTHLLGFDPEIPDEKGPWRSFVELLKSEGESRSVLALAAFVRHGSASDGVAREQAALEQRLSRSLEFLGKLAQWIHPAGDDGAEPLARLVDDLEAARRSVEDATAAKLFAEAVDFAPGRIAPDTLLDCFDHAWITGLLGWDRARLVEWATTVREGWLRGWRDEECLPLLFTGLATASDVEPSVADFLARLAVVYRPEGALQEALGEGPQPWRDVNELAFFHELEELFEADVPEEAVALGAEALPIQLEALREDPDDERLLPEGSGPDSFGGELAAALGGRRVDVDHLVELARTLAEIWELRYQETVRHALDLVRKNAARDELGPEGGLVLSAAGRERAAERAEYFLKDHGTRPRTLNEGELTYDVVYLLTRYERDFPGFRVRKLETRSRVQLAGDDAHPAERLVGFVAAPTMEDRLSQRHEEAELRELKSDPDRTEREAEELRRLIGEVRLPNEFKGVLGIESFFDRELTGANGFSLTRGMADVYGAGGDELRITEARDGDDVVLTLDAGLQAAVQRCLRHPSDHEDKDWQANPVGAVVLLDASGDVLAAASEPDDESLLDPEAGGQRQFRMERTLRKPTFQPPGSTFKVFVASWALAHGLDPKHTVVCGPIERGVGYKDLRCLSATGHGPVDLHSALVQSCNAYFAWLGETLDTAEFAELGELFGFGEPTGVRRSPPWDQGPLRRTGLLEDRAGMALPRDGGEWNDSLRRRAANGLSVVEATPMQLARAMLALAVGEKRELRLVQKVGAREFPRGERVPLALGRESLDFVREAMRDVADQPHGTAHSALRHEMLGFPVAVKTGSADLASPEGDQARVPKHAWVAGWAPADEPALIFVVFEHHTLSTSSHGAIYLARDVLEQPEVRAWLADHGVAMTEPAR
jgi:cell division protein FtsI/penicillin-binding protein 2